MKPAFLRCASCGQRHGICIQTCIICSFDGCSALPRHWASVQGDLPVCRGSCERIYIKKINAGYVWQAP